MAQLNINPSTAQKLEELSQQADKSVDEFLDWLLNTYGHILTSDTDKSIADLTWTEEEIEALLQPQTPLTGKEIAEQGLLGGWADAGITDSLEWVNQQRAKRRKKHQW